MKHSNKLKNIEPKIDPKIWPPFYEIIQRCRGNVGDSMLRMQDVCSKIGRAPSTTYRDIKAGLFPPPVSLGEGSARWKASEVQAVIEAWTLASRTGQQVDMKRFVSLLAAPLIDTVSNTKETQ
jgi:predicted DNA-binding transcriptional regulator AlpA